MSDQRPIVVLDSGLGGLTVVSALMKRLPRERIVYFGDTARLPYGSKTPETVTTFVRQIIEYLRPLDPRHVVIACNTATALAMPAMREQFPDLSISGVIEPGAKAAVVAAGVKNRPVIGIIATEATIRSKAYDQAILQRRNFARLLLQPAPLLVPIIEEGRSLSDPLVALALRQYLTPMLQRGLDVLVLGCTHYPILKPAIAELCGPKVVVIDSAMRCAEDVARRLARRDTSRMTMSTGSAEPIQAGNLSCYVTDNPPRFALLASRFLGVQIDAPISVSPDVLYAQPPAVRIRQAG